MNERLWHGATSLHEKYNNGDDALEAYLRGLAKFPEFMGLNQCLRKESR